MMIRKIELIFRLPCRGVSTVCSQSSSTSQVEHKYVDVDTFNVITGSRNTLRLATRKNPNLSKIENVYALPQPAIKGLIKVIQSCNKLPRVIQNDADMLMNKLLHRKMPADSEEVRRARKMQQMRHYKWKPLAIRTKDEAVEYAIARLPPNYAEAKFVLDQLDADKGFTPESVLDFGSGVGGVFWAAREKWNDMLREFTAVDPSSEISHCAMDIMRPQHSESGLIAPYLNFRRTVSASPNHKFDIVVAQRTLSEYPSTSSRIDLLRLLWERTNRFLILIESGNLDHFNALMQLRDYLLVASYRFDREALLKQLEEKNLLTAEISEVVNNKRSSPYEKYRVLTKKLNMSLKTEIPCGHVFAPCPHDSGCPLFVGNEFKNACQTTIRYPEYRTDGKTKSSLRTGLLKTTFTYMIFKKGNRAAGEQPARVLQKRKCGNHTQCEMCTAFNGIQRFPITKKLGPLYTQLKGSKPGQLFAFNDSVIKSDNEDVEFINRIYNEQKEMLLEE